MGCTPVTVDRDRLLSLARALCLCLSLSRARVRSRSPHTPPCDPFDLRSTKTLALSRQVYKWLEGEKTPVNEMEDGILLAKQNVGKKMLNKIREIINSGKLLRTLGLGLIWANAVTVCCDRETACGDCVPHPLCHTVLLAWACG